MSLAYSGWFLNVFPAKCLQFEKHFLYFSWKFTNEWWKCNNKSDSDFLTRESKCAAVYSWSNVNHKQLLLLLLLLCLTVCKWHAILVSGGFNFLLCVYERACLCLCVQHCVVQCTAKCFHFTPHGVRLKFIAAWSCLAVELVRNRHINRFVRICFCFFYN